MPARLPVKSTDGTSGAGDTGDPVRRARSSANTGPRNGTSTSPLPNSSATMATSTPEAPSLRRVRNPVPSTAFSSRATRVASSRSATEPGPRSSANSAAASRSCRCSAVRRTSMPLLQNSAQYLSRRQSRNLGNHDHTAQLFVRREPLGDQGDEFVGIDETMRRDRSDDGFAVDLVVDPEHRAVDDPGMAMQYGLDLSGGYLESADLDHLLGAVGDAQPAVGVEVADISGAIPAIRKCMRRRIIGQVTGHHRIRPSRNLAQLAWSDGLAVFQRDDSHVDTGHRAPDRVQLRPFQRVAGDDRQLAGSVGSHPIDPDPVRDGLGDALGHR